MIVENKIEESKTKLLMMHEEQIIKSRSFISSKQNQDRKMLKKQLRLVINKQIRAVPGKTNQFR